MCGPPQNGFGDDPSTRPKAILSQSPASPETLNQFAEEIKGFSLEELQVLALLISKQFEDGDKSES